METVQILQTPIKSEGDTKEYRLIKLQNGLKALLVRKSNEDSSESEDLAAANLCVSVGSFDDPPKAMGMAHFLEHMVHMGSVKYPQESEYNDFISANGGRRNAMTASDYTTYFFNISESVFPQAVDRLEQIIEAPLLKKNSMQREREAVDSEYQMQIAKDAIHLQSILKLLINEDQPASQFDCGNLKTLKDEISDDDLHSELLKLHANYVANKICLVLQSRRSLDDMQEIVVEKFSSIKSGDVEASEFNPPAIKDIFKPEFFNKMHYIKSKTPKTALLLSWALPPTKNHYKCRPLDYIAKIFENDGEGGIAHYLREKHLISDMKFYLENSGFASNDKFTLVRLLVDMTSLDKIGEILEAIFSYFLMIKEASIDEHLTLYNNLKEKHDMEFKFHKENSAMRNVLKFATNMLIYDDVDVLRGDEIYQAFDGNIVTEMIDLLNKKDFNIIVLSERHENFPLKEKYYGTEYDEIDFPQAYQTLWDERRSNPEFFLEKPNPFKTTNYDISVIAEESTKYPVKVFEDNIFEVWHKLDDKFKMPHVNFKIKLMSPIVGRSTENFLMMSTYGKLVEHHLKNKLSQATNAGYKVEIESDRNGMLLTLEGYSEKLILLVNKVASGLAECLQETSESTLTIIKDDLKEVYSESMMTTFEFGGDYSDKVLLDSKFTSFELHNEVDNLTLENIQKFTAKFFSQLKVQVLGQGNVTKNQTLQVVQSIQALKINEAADYERRQRCHQLPLGRNVVRMKSLMPNDDNSYIKNYYQIGPKTLRTICLGRLMELILNPKAYDYLRSKEQLGYAVVCRLEDKAGIIALTVIVLSQEKKHLYSEVCGKMETFMNEVVQKTIDEITEEEFTSVKTSRAKALLADELDLDGEVSTNWDAVSDQEYVFDKKVLAAKVTESLTVNDLQQFFSTFTKPENMRKLSVQVIGNSSEETSSDDVKDRQPSIELITEKLFDEEEVISNIVEFQSKLFLYPVVKFQMQ